MSVYTIAKAAPLCRKCGGSRFRVDVVDCDSYQAIWAGGHWAPGAWSPGTRLKQVVLCDNCGEPCEVQEYV